MLDVLAELAKDLFQRAFQLQRQGELTLAQTMCERSIQAHPTAEAHTFLGWTYRSQGRIEDAIAEGKKAIEIDPAFGNPYNDIGAYLIELGRPEEAIPWLEKAIASERYEAYHFPWYNLGRVYLAQEMFNQARACFQKALAIAPSYAPAVEALERIHLIVQ